MATTPGAEDASVAAVIEGLRRWRGARPVGVRLDEALAREQESLKALRRKLGGAGAAWAACCPGEFAEVTRPVGLRSGVLSVVVRDASVRYRVDRWLRGGGLLELQRASGAPVRRVRLESGW